MRTNCTMLYGHIETFEHRVDHLLRLRALQDETGGFQAFIPLAFHPEGNGLKNLPAPTAVDDLRTVAVSRLMLDNVPHVKAYWASRRQGGADRAAVRRRRRRRHRRRRDDLQDGRLARARALTRSRARAAHPRGGARPGRARHAVQRRRRGRRARGGAVGEAAASAGGARVSLQVQFETKSIDEAAPGGGAVPQHAAADLAGSRRPPPANWSCALLAGRGRAAARRGRVRRRAHAGRRPRVGRSPPCRRLHRRAAARCGACCSWPTCRRRARRGRARSVVAHVGDPRAPALARAARRRAASRASRRARREWRPASEGTRGAVIIGDPALQARSGRKFAYVSTSPSSGAR